MKITHENCPECGRFPKVRVRTTVGDIDYTGERKQCPDCGKVLLEKWYQNYCTVCGTTTRNGVKQWFHSGGSMDCQTVVPTQVLPVLSLAEIEDKLGRNEITPYRADCLKRATVQARGRS